MTKLKELVEIRSGYTFREGIDSMLAGDVEVFQSGDLNDYTDIAVRPRIAFTGVKSQLLHKGDILISARGYLKAYIYHGEGAAIASSSILVLRVKRSHVLAEYITAFFNSDIGLRAYMRLSAASSLSTITKANLGEINIPDIPLENQSSLGKLVHTIDTEKRRLHEKMTYLDNIRTATINKVLKEYT